MIESHNNANKLYGKYDNKKNRHHAGTAYMYRSATRGLGQGRWRVARHEEDMGSDIANIKSTAPAELPTKAGLEFLITESGAWKESTIEVKALVPSEHGLEPTRPGQISRQASGIYEEGCVTPLYPHH